MRSGSSLGNFFELSLPPAAFPTGFRPLRHDQDTNTRKHAAIPSTTGARKMATDLFLTILEAADQLKISERSLRFSDCGR